MVDSLVSVIMPCFNCEDYIENSIMSVKSQSYIEWELIIVDDLSSDNSVQIVEKHLDDTRIKLFSNNNNLGGAATRNIAIEKAEGRYIAFLDSDDIWDPFKLEKQLAFMKKRNVGFSFSGYTTMSEHGNIIDYVKPPSKVTFNKMLKHNYIGCLTAMYDTSFYGKVFMPRVKKRQDYALWLKLLEKFEVAYSLQENLGFYRIRKQSLSANKLDALKYYWKVLRSVAKLSIVSSTYYLCLYLFIVGIKKIFPRLYNLILVK